MRFPGDRLSNFLRLGAALGSVLALGSCGVVGGPARPAQNLATALPANGPQSDYPVVIGSPYTVAGTTYAPEDGLNYDQVGVLTAGGEGGNAISATHHTLPMPSYAEVTSLTTGRTILVRIEHRGPMNRNALIGLSSGAMAQLGGADGTPVRVRRVNPPEDHRAMLRSGQPAPLRIDTPMSLVEVLKRKLPGQPLTAPPPQQVAQPAPQATAPTAKPSSAPVVAARPATSSTPTKVAVHSGVPAVARPVAQPAPTPTPTPAPEKPPVAAAATSQVSGKFTVQAAAFSTAERAKSAATKLGGTVTPAGTLFRVRTGPFTTRGQAEASLAKVRAAGYKDARIQNSG